MTVSAEDLLRIRERAGFACEYCGVTEVDCGGPLTVDHHQPQSLGGLDFLANLIYCCWRCNLHKAAYWPATPNAPVLWSPRAEPRDRHFLLLADGRLHPLTPTGEFTLARLRLNRSALVTHRLRSLTQAAEQTLLGQCRDLLSLLEQAQRRHADLLNEHRALLNEQRELLQLFRPQEFGSNGDSA